MPRDRAYRIGRGSSSSETADGRSMRDDDLRRRVSRLKTQPEHLVPPRARQMGGMAERAVTLGRDERRTAPRVPTAADVSLYSEKGRPLATAQMVDVTVEGARVVGIAYRPSDLEWWQMPLFPAAAAWITFHLPGRPEMFRLRCRIRWRKQAELGLSFLGIDDETRRLIGNAIETGRDPRQMIRTTAEQLLSSRRTR